MSVSTSSTAVGEQPAVENPVPKRPKRSLIDLVADYSLPVIFVILVIVFSILAPDTSATMKTILASNSVVAILAFGALIPLVVGQFDGSVGANLGVSAILCTGPASKFGMGAFESPVVWSGSVTDRHLRTTYRSR